MADARQFLSEEICALCNLAGVIPRTVEGHPDQYLLVYTDGYAGSIDRNASFEIWQLALANLVGGYTT